MGLVHIVHLGQFDYVMGLDGMVEDSCICCCCDGVCVVVFCSLGGHVVDMFVDEFVFFCVNLRLFSLSLLSLFFLYLFFFFLIFLFSLSFSLVFL